MIIHQIRRTTRRIFLLLASIATLLSVLPVHSSIVVAVFPGIRRSFHHEQSDDHDELGTGSCGHSYLGKDLDSGKCASQ